VSPADSSGDLRTAPGWLSARRCAAASEKEYDSSANEDTFLRLALWLADVSAEAAAAPPEVASFAPLPATSRPAAPIEIRSIVRRAL
jgi:hypothetical protein